MIPSLVFKKINKKYYKNINEFGFKNGILIFDYKDLLKQNELICEIYTSTTCFFKSLHLKKLLCEFSLLKLLKILL